MAYRLNLQLFKRSISVLNRKAIELQTGYLIIHLMMPC